MGNGLSRLARQGAIDFIRDCYRTPRFRVVTLDRELLDRALDLYERRLDKTSGLTDCLSFVVMQEQGLTDALTADRHFQQAGFRALLLAAH